MNPSDTSSCTCVKQILSVHKRRKEHCTTTTCSLIMSVHSSRGKAFIINAIVINDYPGKKSN